jgi:hypothetical protein
MSQMDVQKASYLSVEVDLASLYAGTEERTWAHIKNRSRQSYAVRMDQTTNIDTVTNFHLCHCSLFQTNVGRHRKLSAYDPLQAKDFSFSSKDIQPRIARMTRKTTAGSPIIWS